jgi:hypothetical protein
VQIALGTNHTCALLDDGTVSCWGMNGSGQLGVSAGPDHYVPVPVAGLADVVQLAAGGDQTCARHADGHVSCWGSNAYGALGDGTTMARSTPAPVTW